MGYRLQNLSDEKTHLSPLAYTSALLLAKYIAITGSEQYWDFFAVTPYRSHLSLIVCDSINFPYRDEQVECSGNRLYQSYDGTLDAIFKDFSGNQSRAYRFAEHLLGLDEQTIYLQFLHFQAKQADPSISKDLYLIEEKRLLGPNEKEQPQVNQLVSAISIPLFYQDSCF